ncbi:unnamed protein product [Closterium sp. NIES-65]|nr:unnamed protein product [Closterium sp. NIES-65]
MGNVTSWHARLSQDNPSDVIVDLSGLSARLPYHFHEVDGSFHLPCDTDVGVVRVEARVSVDVCGFHRAELKPPSGWLDRGGIFLIGRAEGCAVIRLRVRFESERDARMDMVVAGVVGVLSVVALVAMRVWGKALKKLLKD